MHNVYDLLSFSTDGTLFSQELQSYRKLRSHLIVNVVAALSENFLPDVCVLSMLQQI